MVVTLQTAPAAVPNPATCLGVVDTLNITFQVARGVPCPARSS